MELKVSQSSAYKTLFLLKTGSIVAESFSCFFLNIIICVNIVFKYDMTQCASVCIHVNTCDKFVSIFLIYVKLSMLKLMYVNCKRIGLIGSTENIKKKRVSGPRCMLCWKCVLTVVGELLWEFIYNFEYKPSILMLNQLQQNKVVKSN